MKSIYKFNANDVNGDTIASDDEEEEEKMKQKTSRVWECNCHFYEHFQDTSIKGQFNTNLFIENSIGKNSKRL